ncbi:MAG: hypothetical protein MUO31_06885 [Thermodesulfovibrionales bacterium]|nr:hypothetical protein [Thermodesulfovibrionales bacterium]
MKEDEKQFLRMIYEKCVPFGNKNYSVRDVINNPKCPIVSYKRAWYVLGKWSSAKMGLYDYGVTIDLGWLTEKGIDFAKNNET